MSTPQVSVDDPATTFTRQRATRWLSPGLLLHSAVEVVVSGLLGEYNDKRELMVSFPSDEPLDLRTGLDEVWFDYVSDTGDGFDATYAIAKLVSEPALDVTTDDGPVVRLPRGQLLIMGGDQVYPSADIEGYEDRLIGPYRAARPRDDDHERSHLRVIPGNHDWYDGLTAFLRTFCQGRDFGNWQTGQSRSYFAVKLPGRWWLLGVDIQFDTYIDDAQRRYFTAIAEQFAPGDPVIVCTAKPSWVSAEDEDVEAYATLDFLDRELIRRNQAELRVLLTGDRHHYVRYEAADGRQKVTAGGGGAYLSATHHLPTSVTVPPAASRARGKSDPVRHERRGMFPAAAQSRRLGWGVLSLPWTTPSLVALLGGVQSLLALAMIWALSPENIALRRRVTMTADFVSDASPARLASALVDSLASVVLALLVVVASVAFTNRVRTARGWLFGIPHGLGHLAIAVCVTYAAVTLVDPLPEGWLLLASLPIVFVVGGLLATWLVAIYLIVADLAGLNTNELFAAQAIPNYKNLLRLHVAADGDLVIHPVGVEEVPRAWRQRAADDAPTAPRFEPEGGSISYALIEDPVRVSPAPAVTEVDRV